jgi:delta-aminolevulinic acid dehydratase/porphobilinogen synthase
MVKPSLPYLDIISDCTTVAPDHPVACYQVSGEYAMVVAGAEKGIYDLRQMAFETTESMVRAGEPRLNVELTSTDIRCEHYFKLLYTSIP